MWHFIWVFTVCQSFNLGITSIQRVKFCLAYFSFDECFISTNSVDPDGIWDCVAFHLDLHCLPSSNLGITSIQRVKFCIAYFSF